MTDKVIASYTKYSMFLLFQFLLVHFHSAVEIVQLLKIQLYFKPISILAASFALISDLLFFKGSVFPETWYFLFWFKKYITSSLSLASFAANIPPLRPCELVKVYLMITRCKAVCSWSSIWSAISVFRPSFDIPIVWKS